MSWLLDNAKIDAYKTLASRAKKLSLIPNSPIGSPLGDSDKSQPLFHKLLHHTPTDSVVDPSVP
jgi:hypothetical protein